MSVETTAPIRRGREWMLILGMAAAVLFASLASAIVKCRTADGKLIFADSPPPGCVVEGEYKAAPAAAAASDDAEPTPNAGGSTAEEAGAEIIRDRAEKRAEEAAYRREMARRKKLPAVEFVDTYDRQYGNGRFLEGTVANAAAFPVYNVKVCVGGNCRMAAPSTLQPGAQGSFAFEARQNWRRSGEMTVEWDVEP